MNTLDHTDRYCILREAFLRETGKVLTSYIVIGIASDAEVFYGASIDDPADAPLVRAKLDEARRFCGRREGAA